MYEFPFIKRPEDEIEPQEVIFEGLAERRLEVPLSPRALYVLYGIFAIVALVLFTKAIQLQVFSNNQWSILAKQNVAREILIAPERGVIYDKNLVQLTFNEPSFDFVCDKRDMPSPRAEKEAILNQISQVLAQDFSNVKQQFDQDQDSLVLDRKSTRLNSSHRL